MVQVQFATVLAGRGVDRRSVDRRAQSSGRGARVEVGHVGPALHDTHEFLDLALHVVRQQCLLCHRHPIGFEDLENALLSSMFRFWTLRQQSSRRLASRAVLMAVFRSALTVGNLFIRISFFCMNLRRRSGFSFPVSG